MLANLEKRAVEATPAKVSAFVGFTQTYAIHVHEVKRPHKEPTQWKYLETPARTKQNEIAEEVRNAFMDLSSGNARDKTTGRFVSQGGRMGAALLAGCMYLQAEAQLITPKQTGALKASAFSCLEEQLEQKSAEAFTRSESKRTGG